jgi:hypothetical protein
MVAKRKKKVQNIIIYHCVFCEMFVYCAALET